MIYRFAGAILLWGCALIFLSQKAAAQFYFEIGSAYGLGFAKADLGDGEIMSINPGTRDVVVSSARYSYGEGASVHGSLGMKVLSNAYLEASVGYKFSDEYRYDSRIDNIDGRLETNNTLSGTEAFTSLKFGISQSLAPESLKLLIGVGPHLGFRNSFENGRERTVPAQMINVARRFSGGIALGFTAEVKFLKTINEHLDLLLGVFLVNSTYRPNRSEITRYVVNGEHRLEELSPYEREIVYENEFTRREVGVPNLSSPGTALKQSYPFNRWGIMLNVRYNL